MRKLIEWVIARRGFVIAAGALVAAAGIVSLWHLPFDAFPDTTPVLVHVNVGATGYAPDDVEALITAPIERELSGLAGLSELRSISKFGLSQVTCIFKDGSDIYRSRQQIAERLIAIELPEGVDRPQLGPISTGLGEIFHYIVIADSGDPTAARTAQDWIIKPQLQAVPGVVEINSWGGYVKQFQIYLDPQRLTALQLPLTEVIGAIQRGNTNVGGGYTVRAEERFIVQGVGTLNDVRDIENIVIASRTGVPIRVTDVGEVVIGHELRAAATTYDGKGEAVLGLGFMLTGENSHRIARDLREQLDLAKKALPNGISAHTVYDRTNLVDQVLSTVKHNLIIGAALVIAVLFLFLGSFRAAILVASIIPLSMLFAFNLMQQVGIAGSLMSLGAIDFGLAVDNGVIQVENAARRLRESVRPRLETIRDAIWEVQKPALFGQLIIMLVYLPILSLEGVEGKMFRPMAWTVIFVLGGSLILSFTVLPALAALFLRRSHRREEPRFVEYMRRAYRPSLVWSLKHSRFVLIAAAALVLISGVAFFRVGSEFIPRLSEGSIVINVVRLAGISLEQSLDNGSRIERILKEKFPDEVAEVWSRTGTPELATDPMGVELTDVFITLTPRSRWKQANSQTALVDRMDKELSDLPGMNLIFTQPIEMRLAEMTAGIRADLGIKIFGDDMDQLKEKAREVETIVRGTEGAADVTTEQITGQPIIRLEVDRTRLGRYALSSSEVLEAIQAIGGVEVGEVREGDRRFELVSKLSPRYSATPEDLDRILLPSSAGELVPLTNVARLVQTEGPSTITREWGKRRITVQCNVRGRDVGSFVNDVRHSIDQSVSLEPGYFIRYGGQFEHLERARLRLLVVVPFALLLIFALLYWSYKSWRDAILIFTGVPLAAAGGVWALIVRGMPFTISAGVGFIALSGIAVLNGLVLVSTIRQLRANGDSLPEAIKQGASLRMRPVLMTALVAAMGFVPMALSHGVGAEVQRPLATVVIGGILTSTLLTLIVLPALYGRYGHEEQHESP
jgi:cobalt-zinc-cadmium resistance protein CzcA